MGLKKIFLVLTLCPAFAALLGTAAFAQELVLGGQAIGIQISTRGVLVAGLTDVETSDGERCPAGDAGICTGDLIVGVGESELDCAQDFVDAVGELNGQPVTVVVEREGSITDAEIISVVPGSSGTPGELNGCADTAKTLGNVEQNTELGIYGHIFTRTGNIVVETGDMHTGPATIISTVNGHEAKEYDAEINRIYNETGGQRMMLTVTDPELRSITGGIVQGMSGSPVMQDGKLIGAVTHVFVSDPCKGFGISIYDMLETAGIREQAA